PTTVRPSRWRGSSHPPDPPATSRTVVKLQREGREPVANPHTSSLQPLKTAAVLSTVMLIAAGCAEDRGSGGSGGGGPSVDYGASKEEYAAALADMEPVTLTLQSTAPKGGGHRAPVRRIRGGRGGVVRRQDHVRDCLLQRDRPRSRGRRRACRRAAPQPPTDAVPGARRGSLQQRPVGREVRRPPDTVRR